MNAPIKHAVFLFSFLFAVYALVAQPANDNCANATTISPIAWEDPVSYNITATTQNATPSANAPGCAGAGPANDDIWYTFTASAASIVIRFAEASQIPSGATGLGLALYNSGCPTNSSSFYCNFSVGFNSGHVIINGLTIGQTVLLRCWSPGTASPIQFKLCVQDLPVAPANDECSGATSLAVNPFGQTCTTPLNLTTAGATASATPAASCGGSDNNDDIWVKFTATSAQHIFRFSNMVKLLGNPFYLGITIYDGGPSGSATCPVATNHIFCTGSYGFSSGYKLVGGFVIGHTYYVRLWAADTENFASFDFCVQEVPPPPANDDCANATSLAVNPFGQTCTTPLNLTTAGATASATPAASCGGSDNNDDIWVKFTATSAQHIFRFSNMVKLLGNPFYLGITIYDGGPSGSATCPVATNHIFCTGSYGFSSGYKLVGGFAIGHTYYVRLWAADTENFASFDFCVQEVPPPPANDDCANATSLAVNPFGQTCTTPLNLTTTGATASATPAASCGGSDNNDDIWVKFTATSAQHIFRFSNMVKLLGNPFYLGITIYDGGPSGSATCPVATNHIFCTGSYGFSSGYKLVGGFAIGHTYYVRLWAADTENFASFDFCVQEVPPPPANDDCANATSLAVNPFGQTCTTPLNLTTAGATASATPAASCGGSDNNDDIWVKFTATSAQHIFRFSNMVKLLGNPFYLGITIYDGGPSGSATCPVATNHIFCTGSYGFSSGYKLVGGFAIGHTYYVRLWAADTENFASFDFCVQEVPPPPANDDCANAVLLIMEASAAGCMAPVTVNTSGATQSANKPSCLTDNNVEDDVWYKFTPTGEKIRLDFSNLQQLLGDPNSIGFAIYKGVCPLSSAAIHCTTNFGFFNGKTLLEGFEPGATYYLRIWSTGNENFASFSLCLQSVFPPPNDECNAAVSLSVGAGFCTGAAVTNLFDATTSTGDNSSPSCRNGGRTEDVWFSAIVPATGKMIVETSPANPGVADLVMVAYTGACGSLVQLDCNDDGNPLSGAADAHPRLAFAGRTPGEKITFRVVAAHENYMGRFSICAWDTSLAVQPAIAPAGNCSPMDTLYVSDNLANGYRWLPVFDGAGRIVAEILPNHNQTDTFFTKLYVHTSGQARAIDGRYYADRNISITNPAKASQGRIKFYIKTSEINSLRGSDSTITGITNLVISSDTGTCLSQIAGAYFWYQNTWAAYNGGYAVEIAAGTLGNYFAWGACGETITWTGGKSTDWHDPENWDCKGVPYIQSKVIIPAGRPRYPLIQRATEVKELWLQPNALVHLENGVVLKVNGVPQ